MINDREQMERQRRERIKRGNRPLTEQEKADRAILSVMKDWPLEPGQMLLLGPKSCAALLNTMTYHPSQLTDKYILDKSEWGVVE